MTSSMIIVESQLSEFDWAFFILGEEKLTVVDFLE